MQDRKVLKITDLIIGALVLSIAVLSFLFVFNNNNNDLTAVVNVDGKTTKQIVLNAVKKPYTVTLNGKMDVRLFIEPDGVTAEYSQCPDKVCIHTGKITHENQSIVCMPARISVTLVKNNSYIDAIAG